MISFSVPGSAWFSAQERLDLRRYINEAGASEGFEPCKPRESPLAPEVIEGVRNGDQEAWTDFVRKHEGSWIANADRLIGGDSNPMLLEPEDIVGDALARLMK